LSMPFWLCMESNFTLLRNGTRKRLAPFFINPFPFYLTYHLIINIILLLYNIIFIIINLILLLYTSIFIITVVFICFSQIKISVTLKTKINFHFATLFFRKCDIYYEADKLYYKKFYHVYVFCRLGCIWLFPSSSTHWKDWREYSDHVSSLWKY
jgi:hypothetical protein